MLKSHRKSLYKVFILMLGTYSTLLSLLHEDKPKYAETRGGYTAPCKLHERLRLQPWIQTAVISRRL